MYQISSISNHLPFFQTQEEGATNNTIRITVLVLGIIGLLATFFMMNRRGGSEKQQKIEKTNPLVVPNNAMPVDHGVPRRVEEEKLKKTIVTQREEQKDLIEKAKFFILNINSLQRAPFGTSEVYFSENSSIVLKKTGLGTSQDRIRVNTMEVARNKCKEKNCQNLIIPEACVYEGFIIESKLPIIMYKTRAEMTKAQIGLYMENHEKFSLAVQEFTRFLHQTSLFDIVGGKNPYAPFSETPLGRYDNLPLYLQNDQGKIGLIDLDGFRVDENPDTREYFSKCKNLVHLFPLHLEEIFVEATQFDPGIKDFYEQLEAESEKALAGFRLICEDYSTLITKESIELEKNPLFVKVESDRLDKIKDAIEEFLRV